jgi:hypothetical protein
MLSEPPNRCDLRAAAQLVTGQRQTGVSDRQRDRLVAMHLIVTGPPFEFTTRGKQLLAVVLLAFVTACGGAPFTLSAAELGPDAGGAPLTEDVVAAQPADAGVGTQPTRDAGAWPPDAAVADRQEPRDAGAVDAAADVLEDRGIVRLDAGAPDVVVAIDAGAPDVSTDPVDAGPADVAPMPLDANCGAQSATVYGCACETPASYSCFARGTICGSCAPQVAGDPFGHADGACTAPNVCRLGAPCVWQAASGAQVHGSVIACP